MIKQMTIKEAKDLIKENQKVFLIFSTKWCGDCKMSKFVWDKVLPDYNDQIKVGKIDVDEEKTWAENGTDFQIDHVPTIYGYKNGEAIFTHQNFITEPELRELLDKL